MGFDDVFHIVEEPLRDERQLGELPKGEFSPEELRTRVLAAHRSLMSMNDENRDRFVDLVEDARILALTVRTSRVFAGKLKFADPPVPSESSLLPTRGRQRSISGFRSSALPCSRCHGFSYW